MEWIDNYDEKKVADYIKPGDKVLLRFGHGLGDTIMFMPVFERLKTLYPEVQFDLYLECGQEEIFTSVPNGNGEGYDYVFILHFPMSEGSDLTKSQKCCTEELGIEPFIGDIKLPFKISPMVAVHFHGTALPDSVRCSENVAEKIWNEIITAGKIPIECHFEHIFHNPVNKKYDFITNNVRNCTANLHNLIGLLEHCFAFIGVASGPFIAALSIMPLRTLYLERNHKLESYTKQILPKINLNEEYADGYVKNWLLNIEKRWNGVCHV